MDWLLIAFRLLHIIAAVIWAGGAFLFFFYLEPAIFKLGPDAEKFVDEVVNKRKIPVYFAVASTITVIGGILLYIHDAGGLQLWTSPNGIGFTIGAIAGILAWAIGASLIPKGLQHLGAIGAEIRAAGGPPSGEMLGRMHAAQESLHRVSLADAGLIAVAVVFMSASRYFS
jgi:uncharacterized membrane protein